MFQLKVRSYHEKISSEIPVQHLRVVGDLPEAPVQVPLFFWILLFKALTCCLKQPIRKIFPGLESKPVTIGIVLC